MNAAHVHDAHHDEHPRGFSRWLFTTNHKDIGRMYIIFSVVMFLVGGMLAMLIRTELLRPWLLIPPEVYNQIITVHGLVMVFAAVMPAGSRRRYGCRNCCARR